MFSHSSSPSGLPSARWVPLLLAGLWIAALAALAYASANPVTLNRAQILQSSVVVSARIDNAATGACTIDRYWKGPGEEAGAIIVRGLPADRIEEGRSYILPLIRRGAGEFEVVPVENLEQSPRLIYPATPAAVEQLERICGR